MSWPIVRWGGRMGGGAMKKYLLEVCVDSVESACIAAANGADRLELCSNLVIGGTTPTLALFEEIRKKCNRLINVLIRPRFGDFCYSDWEYEVIKREIRQFVKAGADGIVIGFLKPDGNLDCDRMEEGISLARGKHVTLHRAFDVCRDPYQALEQAAQLGVNTILTSGQEKDCMAGLSCLKALALAAGDRIAIMAGSGVSPDNMKTLHEEAGIRHFHMSGKKTLASRMEYRRENVPMGIPAFSEFEIWQTDGEKVARGADILKGFLQES